MHQIKSLSRQFKEEGYLIFPEIFVGDELQRLLTACNYVHDQFAAEHDRLHPGVDFISMSHMNDSRWHSDTREHFKTIMETVADPRCLGIVEQIFGSPSLFRSMQYFVNRRYTSSEGNWHRDSQFGAKDDAEERANLDRIWKGDYSQGYGLQFQIALVDNDDVEFVPYSGNRYDSPEEAYIRLAGQKSHNLEDGMPNALRVELKAGDALIFNPFGLHRGRYYKEIPRRTLMLTYTPEDYPTYDSFSTQPWFEEPGYLDGLSPRAITYFQQFIDVFRNFWKEGK
ncbi:phytanoyl-CoA dioxygenase family protein [Paenibacillus eucommiae]|uniref:Ectoine hydroxylase-related dioxygenase (Phytanoyl-CoA dioxygenase family) n=1 Tax=Paenibacillus eucommiae TaxID=1355755 RepID=A0ABS4IP61_9BACL|nr:phytanoyl-CoA dioxygenase family protein [Paenibacillus eucommiae]MBP1989346.1 ectoine hydroxylase-related dioxygenase (phytanoyl-CoA dioxygenase family) [Paenibacillus eucommiae]